MSCLELGLSFFEESCQLIGACRCPRLVNFGGPIKAEAVGSCLRVIVGDDLLFPGYGIADGGIQVVQELEGHLGREIVIHTHSLSSP